MNCPRCGFALWFRQADARWLAHFECPECWFAFHFEKEKMRVPVGPRTKRLRTDWKLFLVDGRVMRAEAMTQP
jgi:hypothetical protein